MDFRPGAPYLFAALLKLVVASAHGGSESLLKIAQFLTQPIPLRFHLGEPVAQFRQHHETPGQRLARGRFVTD
jgi:hypothetical protein